MYKIVSSINHAIKTNVITRLSHEVQSGRQNDLQREKHVYKCIQTYKKNFEGRTCS